MPTVTLMLLIVAGAAGFAVLTMLGSASIEADKTVRVPKATHRPLSALTTAS